MSTLQQDFLAKLESLAQALYNRPDVSAAAKLPAAPVTKLETLERKDMRVYLASECL
jgi:hypothetical protein